MSDPKPARRPLLPPRLVKPLAIAFGVGLLLFLLLWLDQRSNSDFFKAGGPDGAAQSEGDALPVPVPADVAGEDGDASGPRGVAADSRRPPPGTELPRIVEPAPPPPAPMPVPEAPVAARTDPVPVSRPAPRYPSSALRQNIGGSVRVQVTVAPDGSVERMELLQGSGHRELDRAAMEAVRRWRFQPATRDGQPVSATVVVPLEFNPAG